MCPGFHCLSPRRKRCRLKFTQPLSQSLHYESQSHTRWCKSRILSSPACTVLESGLNRRNDLVVPPLGGENEINPDHRRIADGVPGAALDSPRLLNGWRLAATTAHSAWVESWGRIPWPRGSRRAALPRSSPRGSKTSS